MNYFLLVILIATSVFVVARTITRVAVFSGTSTTNDSAFPLELSFSGVPNGDRANQSTFLGSNASITLYALVMAEVGTNAVTVAVSPFRLTAIPT